MVLEYLKRIIIKVGNRGLKDLPDIPSLLRLKRKFYLAELKRSDWAKWNVERALDIGVKVGANCRFYSAKFFSEPYLVEIGDNVIISGEVIFVTHDGGIYLLKDEINDLRGYYGKIKIGSNCFIGMGAIILPNVQIGDNCIIGAGAVVANSFPENSVIMGNPAKVAFKTSIYIKMRKNSRNIVKCEEWPFPTRIPDHIKKDLLINKCMIPEPAKVRVSRKQK